MHFVAYLVVALITFVVGGFWYSPAGFLKLWARESKMELDALKPKDAKHPAIVFGLAYVASVIAVGALAHFMGDTGHGAIEGLKFGAMAGAPGTTSCSSRCSALRSAHGPGAES